MQCVVRDTEKFGNPWSEVRTSYFLGLDIPLGALFSNTTNLYSFSNYEKMC
jgi:hypothetical protein